MHERVAGQVLHAQRRLLRERVVAPAHEVEAVAAENLGRPFGTVGRRRGQGEVRPPGPHELEALVGERVVQGEIDGPRTRYCVDRAGLVALKSAIASI